MQLSLAKPHAVGMQASKPSASPQPLRPIYTVHHPAPLSSNTNYTTLSSNRIRPLPAMRAQSTAEDVKLQPDWANKDRLLSKFVDILINTKPIYSLMKIFAKQAIKNSAEERGISWDGYAKTLMADSELQQIKEELEKKDMVYPSYYLQPFHAYDEGNLNWQAACEVEPATYAMAIRTFKSEPDLTPTEAFSKMRTAITAAVKDFHAKHSLSLPSSIVDVGCSTGMSTRWFAKEFPDAKVTGTDLSPYFLAVAELEERKHISQGGARRISYIHDKVEDSVLESSSVDLLSFQFVLHECPQETIRNFMKASARIVRPGGVICIVDNNPKSKTIQNLPPALFTLMKSTEPWSDEYYACDVEQCMRDAGFTEVETVCTDHRHRAVLGIRASQ